MDPQTFTVDDLMDVLVRKVGLPEARRTKRVDVGFTDLGLDSLAFLELQIHLSQAYGVELPDDRAQAYTVGDIVDTVQQGLRREVLS